MKHIMKFTWPAHLIGLGSSVYAVLAEHWWFFGLTFTFWALLSIGMEVGIHRLFSHQAFTTPRWVELTLMVLGSLAGQGSVMFWVAIHKGYHHPKADTKDDPHSPVHGFYMSYIGWMIHNQEDSWSYRSAAPLMRDPAQRFLQKWYYPLIWGTSLALCLLSPLVGGAYLMACVMCLHQNLMVNWLCHTGTRGYKTYENPSQARNLPWLSIPTWGLSLHNNHHHDPGSYTLSRAWWEFDPSSWVIRLISTSRRGARQ